MKNYLLTILSIAFLFAANAQVNPNAIGIRGGGGYDGNGAEISYQKGIGEANRLELDFGFRSRKYYNNGNGKNWYYRYFGVTACYHWVWNLTDGLNWFVGPGAQVGFYDDYYDNNSGVAFGIGGQIGLEYDFNAHGVPILLGLDARPMWNLNGYYDGFGGGAAFSIRYTF